MNARQQTTELKRRLRTEFPGHEFRAQWGRGTASHWIYVQTDLDRPKWDQVRAIAGEYAGTYLSDSLPGKDEYVSCVRVEGLR